MATYPAAGHSAHAEVNTGAERYNQQLSLERPSPHASITQSSSKRSGTLLALVGRGLGR